MLLKALDGRLLMARNCHHPRLITPLGFANEVT